MSLPTLPKVETLQTALHEKAKRSPDFRFYSLYDKVYRKDVLWVAYRRCRINGGAAGIDGQTFEDIEASGQQRWLDELAEELRTKSYQPSPVKRVRIPKADGQQRPLGIPTIRDRVVQRALVLVLEPIFEADLQPEQQACRPGKSVHDAIRESCIGTYLSKKKDTGFCREISEMTSRRRTLLPVEDRGEKINRKRLGWSNDFCLGPVSKAYAAVERHVCRRLRQWLCAKHKVPGQGTSRFPDEHLHQTLDLVKLPERTRNFSWANP